MSAPRNFGDPIYADQASGPPQQQQPVNGQAQQAQPEIDINDPRLTSESLAINPEGDAYARPPLLLDGKYRAKLKQLDVETGKRYLAGLTKKDSRPYLYTVVESSVIDLKEGKWDGIRVTDYFVSTLVNRDGSMPIATIMHRIGKPLPKSVTPKQAMDAFLHALAAEPECGIETAWEWSCQKCGEEADRAGTRRPRATQGMHNFPQVQMKDANGKPFYQHNPELRCTVDPRHGTSVARPRIVHYLSLTEVK